MAKKKATKKAKKGLRKAKKLAATKPLTGKCSLSDFSFTA